MNIFKSFLLLLLIVLFLSVPVFSATHYNSTVNKLILPSGVLYYGEIDMTADTTGTWYTQAFDVSFQDRSQYIYLAHVCTDISGETEDVNVFTFYSLAPVPTVANGIVGATDDDKDQLQTTLEIDTLTVEDGTAAKSTLFKGTRWCSIKIIGQTGNPHTTYKWWVFVPFAQNVDYRHIDRNQIVTNMNAS